MVSLRKLFLIPTALVALAGIASAAQPVNQILCTPVAATSLPLRSEGRTEKLAPLTMNCTVATPGGAGTTVGYQIGLTSATLQFTSPATPDPMAPSMTTKIAAAAATAATTTVTVSPAQILFTGVVLPDSAASFTLTIDNIFVDASTLPLVSTPTVIITAIATTPAVSDGNLFPGPVNVVTTATVATVGKSLYVYDSLTVGGVQKPTSFDACANESIDTTLVGGGTNGHVIDTVTFAPLTVTSFALRSRLVATFSNLPSGVQLYVPLTITTTGTTVASLVTGYNPTTLTGGFVATVSAGATDKLAPVGPSGMIVYEITVPGSDLITFDVTASAKGPVLAATPVTLTAGYAPLGGSIPRFVGGTAISSNFFTVAPCSSSLFFPYVVAGGGYDTGIAISSSGVLGDASKSASGQCVISYMGKNAPMTTKTLDVTVGQTSAFDIVGSMPTANFYGYAVAKCNFLNASGYAYVANSTGGTASYLPLDK